MSPGTARCVNATWVLRIRKRQPAEHRWPSFVKLLNLQPGVGGNGSAVMFAAMVQCLVSKMFFVARSSGSKRFPAGGTLRGSFFSTGT